MILNEKEQSVIEDLQTQEKSCVEKYLVKKILSTAYSIIQKAHLAHRTADICLIVLYR